MQWLSLIGEFGEDQLVHQVVETILTATATNATEEPPSHEPDSVATSNNSKCLCILMYIYSCYYNNELSE